MLVGMHTKSIVFTSILESKLKVGKVVPTISSALPTEALGCTTQMVEYAEEVVVKLHQELSYIVIGASLSKPHTSIEIKSHVCYVYCMPYRNLN